jgi:hypothetical protein
METRVSGFRVHGTWEEVVEHGARITQALEDIAQEGDPLPEELTQKALDEWETWRPKDEERIDQEMNEKTADQASIGEGEGEAAGKAPREDMAKARAKLRDAFRAVGGTGFNDAVKRLGESFEYAGRAMDSAGRKALRKVEDTVYKRVMTQIAPYYFDNELVSANVRRARGDDDPFAFEVNVNDDEVKAAVADHLEDYEDDVKRWHVHVEKDTTVAEAAEGAEAPEPQADEDDGRRT